MWKPIIPSSSYSFSYSVGSTPLIHLQIIYQILDFLTKRVSTDQSGTTAANKVS